MTKKSAILIPLLTVSAGLTFMGLNAQENAETASANSYEKLNVLYVTHEPGKYHAYTPQREIFEKIAKENNWKLRIISGSHDEVEEKLATTPDFGKGADVIVYNFCMAHAKKLEAPHNIIQQTKKDGTPALLLHCSLHSFWSTYKTGRKSKGFVHVEGQPKQVKASPELIATWKEAHPNADFPSWTSFTGIASTSHGPKKSINTKVLKADHPVFEGFTDYTTTNKAELYNNFVTPTDSPTTIALLEGKQLKKKAVILWEHAVGESKTMSFTLGHDTEEWSQKEFQKLLINSVNYLAEKK
jgi:hypothetical protein